MGIAKEEAERTGQKMCWYFGGAAWGSEVVVFLSLFYIDASIDGANTSISGSGMRSVGELSAGGWTLCFRWLR